MAVVERVLELGGGWNFKILRKAEHLVDASMCIGLYGRDPST